MRPLARPYLQHGTRHLPAGSDPIPGVGVIPFIIAHGTASVASSPTTDHYASLDAYATSDDSVFGITLGTGGLAAINGISVDKVGIYRVFYSFLFDAATNGDTLTGGALAVGGVQSPNFLFHNDQMLDETQVVYSTTTVTGTRRVEYARLFYLGGEFDTTTPPAGIWVSAHSSANNFNFGVTVTVEQLGPSYTTNVTFGNAP